MLRASRRSTPFAASILCALAFTVAASSSYAADVAITDEARSHFSAGVNLLKDPDGARYEEAYREFRAAYAAAASYKILGNLGLCAMKLERDGEAIDAYEKYLEHGADLDPPELAQIKTDLSTLKSGVVRLTINSDPPGGQLADTRVPVRGEKVVNLYDLGPTTAIGIRPGHHVFTIKLQGYADFVWEFDAPAGQSLIKDVRLEKPVVAPIGGAVGPGAGVGGPAPEAPRPTPGSAYIGLAATGALAVGTAVVGIMATGKHSDFKSKNDGTDPAAAKALSDSGKTLNLVTDILLGATLVAGGVTTYLFVAKPGSPKSKEAAFVRLTPGVAPQSAGLFVDGAF